MPKGFKKKSIKSTLDDGDVQGLLKRILDDAGSMHITYDKYLKYKSECESYLKLLKFIRDISSDPSMFESPYDLNIDDYIAKFEASIKSDFNVPDLKPYFDYTKIDPRDQYADMPQEIKDLFVDSYKRVENNSICTRDILATRAHMNSLQSVFQKREGNNWVFIDHTTITDFSFITGVTSYILAPVEGLPNLNFAQMYNLAQDCFRPLVISLLAKLYKCCDDFYNIVMIPNSDPDYFVTIVVSSIEKLQQALPNCKEAFDKINESTELLRENYGEYYSNLKTTDNVTGVIDKFLTDVKSQKDVPIKVALQFNDIIKYFHKVSKSKGISGDPLMKKMFKGVKRNLKEVNKIARERGEIVDEDI
jgi:hypothetical protein